MTDTSKEAVERCAECTCERGGVYCNWIASTPAAYMAEIARVTAERDAALAWIAREAEDRGDADAEYPPERQCARILAAQPPTGDMVSREAVLDILTSWTEAFGHVEIKHTSARRYAVDAVADFADLIRALPATPAQEDRK